MKINKWIKRTLIYLLKRFRKYQELKELFEQESGYLFITENIQSFFILRKPLGLNKTCSKANLELESLIKFLESIKLITWVNIGHKGEIVASPGKGELINRFNIVGKQISFYN
jgi:hypothetical protein